MDDTESADRRLVFGQQADEEPARRFDAHRIFFWIMVLTAVTAVVLAAVIGSA
jgi:hypothetical protein